MDSVSGLSKTEFQKKFARVGDAVFDHVVPMDAFDFTKPEHVVRACFWKNLRVITRKENQDKGAVHDCADVMSLPWTETEAAMVAARRFITRPEDRWKQTDWSKSDSEIASWWGLSVKIVNDRRRDIRLGRLERVMGKKCQPAGVGGG